MRWYNFYDVHSDISHYEWRVGLSPGNDDVIPSRTVHNTHRASHRPDQPLPTNVKMFTTVKAINKAGN